ncbi:hypothetical protein KUTeg_019569 [Tegillarca granosa]|uniref:Riboflavin transporter n=1 Tax=Tegillarca granosa TaxID=220873 RepID=A0ABQ9ECT7_TEGGR|nr:hypothetical protein KUTeg_019567 [Tegillarca granosa]KAJ8303173.1 hypothetical protein KUTeg_019569 [Tegillarca granosa]
MARDIFKCGETNVLVYIIVSLFGIGSWVAINGLWVELPVIVPHLPEKWKLPSFLTVIIQLANIGPIIVTILNHVKPGKMPEKSIIYSLVFIGSASCLLLAFFWKRTSFIAGEEHSTALLILQFFLALVDCTSSVVFLPFMAVFKEQYMTAYFIGEGMSGLVPSLVALGQGVGQMDCLNKSFVNSTTNDTTHQIVPVYYDPLFPVEDFFFFLFAMMLVCGLAFTLLNFLPYCKQEQVTNTEDEYSETSNSVSASYELDNHSPGEKDKGYSNAADAANSQTHLIRQNVRKRESKNLEVNMAEVIHPEENKLSLSIYIYYLLLIAWINALSNGVLPSIQSYSCLPYGNEAYHLAVTFASITNPLACFAAFFIPVKSSVIITFLTFLGTGVASYILVLAALSPEPFLLESLAGSILVVAAWVLVTLFFTFSKVTIAAIFRTEGRKALLWCGAITQLGSAIGAIITYVLVNVLELFQSGPPCPS